MYFRIENGRLVNGNGVVIKAGEAGKIVVEMELPGEFTGSVSVQEDAPIRETVCDTGDNCSVVPNPNQMNMDNDGIGDSCDNCPTTEQN